MNIVLIADSYPPEIRSVSLMMKELAEDLVSRGHDVTVVTYWPQYNLSADAREIKFKDLSIENNVRVIRVKTPPHHNVNFIIRGISELISPFLFWMKIKKLINQRIDAVIVYISPLPLALVGSKVKKEYGSRFILNIQDIFPLVLLLESRDKIALNIYILLLVLLNLLYVLHLQSFFILIYKKHFLKL